MKWNIISSRTLVTILAVLLFCSFRVVAQKPAEISLTLYPGFTLVNFEKALDYSDDYMEDWSEFHFAAVLRGFLSSEKVLQTGAEIGWHSLYYAYYKVPYGYSPVYREFDVSTLSLMVLERYMNNSFFAVGGAGIHFFDDGIAPAFLVEAGYSVMINDRTSIPLSFQVSPVFGAGTPVTFSGGAGISFSFD